MSVTQNVFISAIILASVPATAAVSLPLSQYQQEVRKGNETYRASLLKAEGAKERGLEGKLLFSPNAFAGFQYTDDRRPTLSSAFQGNQTVIQSYDLGVSQQTRFGLNGKLTYTLPHTRVNGASPALVPENAFYNGAFGLELSLPLWKNAFGRQFRWQEQTSLNAALSSYYAEEYTLNLILMESELRYWRLAIARELVRIQEDSYDRALKLSVLQEKRAKQRLIDTADMLQARAALKLRELELKNAKNEERLAQKAFNEYRGAYAADPVSPLMLPDPRQVNEFKLPLRNSMRNDVAAAQMAVNASILNAELSRDRLLPSLDVFANTSWNGRSPQFSAAASQSFSTDHPLYSLGIRLSVPLDIGTTSGVREGYQKEKVGAELAFQRKIEEQENDWTDLVQKFEDGKERLRVVLELEDAQRMKLQAERERFSQGRSTTYQLFLFEQEYLGAQLSRVQTLSQVLSLRAQMNTFRKESL